MQNPPDSTDGLNWSGNPGCFEIHLKRKVNNPFFPKSARTVTQEQIEEAKAQDGADAAALREKFAELVDGIGQLSAASTFQDILDLREGIDALLEEAASIGGEVGAIRDQLLPLRESVVDTIRQAIVESEDPGDMLETLDALEANYHAAAAIFHSPFIAQVWRLPMEDLVPALLSEPPEVIRMAMSMIGEESRTIIAEQAGALMKKVESEGIEIPEAAEKLKALAGE